MSTSRAHILTLAAALLVSFVMGSCSAAKTSKSTIPVSSRSQGYEGVVFRNLLVIGVGENENTRRLFEDAFAKTLAEHGARAQPSWTHLPQSTLLTETELEAVVQGGGFDGVLITRLLGVDEEEEYVEGRSYSKRHALYPHYKGYYRGAYEVVHEPGYFTSKKTYRLETNLYAVSDSSLVWSGQSDTVDPDSMDEGISSMTEAVAKKLEEERLIRSEH